MTDKISILAIDDNMANLIALKAIINDALPDAEVYTALDGVSGMEIASREDIDAILLDIIMPVMNGYEVCTRLKKDEQLRHIPVVFLTAQRTDRESRIKALDSGAEGFLTKPLDEAELVAQIRAMAKIKEANTLKQMEKERLAALVAERTRELELELRKRKEAEEVRQKLEEELNKTQKLESLGVLAGGIAHDFNNLLGGIYGYIDMAREQCSQGSKLDYYLEKAVSTFHRAKDLTMQLLTFAKGGIPVKKTGSLTSLIKDSTLFALSGSNISVIFRFAPDLWLCDFDENQIGQAINNIVINAVHAMPKSGTLHVTLDNTDHKSRKIASLVPGKYVHFSLTDTGTGIAPEILPRIFDPFFTTKPTGNGLGLSTVYSIVKRHDGEIKVKSVLNKGTTFHIYLPASQNKHISVSETANHSHHGSGRILIMDDEESIRETVAYMLENMGYEVSYVDNGKDALEIFHQANKANKCFDAIIMDLTIRGGMCGKETVGELRKTDQTIPVFVASGYSEDPIMGNPTVYGFTDRIQKPFTKDALSEIFNRHGVGKDNFKNSKKQ